ncbi:amidohydrolase family protein [Burkholderia cepacia]|uniref:amidohydrolase family protein n=1 Tax=Burkholderia cepacia TaxID=292 RepID=UPI002FE29A14
MKNTIFDADAHIMDSESDIARHAGISRRRLMPSDAWDRSMGGGYPFVSPSIEQHLAFMDDADISQAVVYPTRSLSLGLVPEMDIAKGIVDGYHHVARTFCEQSRGRILPAALALPHRPAWSAARVEQYRKDGFVALTLLPHGRGGLLGDERFFELYESCEAASMPITVHPNSAGVAGLDEFDTFVEVHTCSVPFVLAKQLVSLTFSGVFEHFPKLRWFFPEAGAGWITYWIDRMEKEFALRRTETRLSEAPSELLVRTGIYVGFGGVESGLDVIDQSLGGGVVWASDYPHWDHEKSSGSEELVQRYGQEASAKMLYGNAKSLYFGDR